MIWISLFSLWSSWYSFSAHCQPTHFQCVCVCVCVCMCVYLYLFSLHCTKCDFFFPTWRIGSCSVSLYWLLFSFTYSRPRAPTVLSSWLTMRMTTCTTWVLHTQIQMWFFSTIACVSLTYISFIFTCHTDKPWDDQTPFTGVIYYKTSTNGNIMGTAKRLLEPFCLLQFSLSCMILTENDMRIILIFLPSDKALMSRLAIISQP